MTTSADRTQLTDTLFDMQNGKCFICEDTIDRQLHPVDIDHIVPRARGGKDEPNNLALAHEYCNRSKGASNLKVARALAKFSRLREQALAMGKRGANLGDLLEDYGGATTPLTLRHTDGVVQFSLSEIGRTAIQSMPILHDELSGADSFFTSLPLAYLHHDDRINPRDIGANLEG